MEITYDVLASCCHTSEINEPCKWTKAKKLVQEHEDKTKVERLLSKVDVHCPFYKDKHSCDDVRPIDWKTFLESFDGNNTVNASTLL